VEIVAGLDTPQVVFFVVLALVFVLLLRSGFATWLRCSSSSRWAPRGRSAGAGQSFSIAPIGRSRRPGAWL